MTRDRKFYLEGLQKLQAEKSRIENELAVTSDLTDDQRRKLQKWLNEKVNLDIARVPGQLRIVDKLEKMVQDEIEPGCDWEEEIPVQKAKRVQQLRGNMAMTGSTAEIMRNLYRESEGGGNFWGA